MLIQSDGCVGQLDHHEPDFLPVTYIPLAPPCADRWECVRSGTCGRGTVSQQRGLWGCRNPHVSMGKSGRVFLLTSAPVG